jgi:hypothetical protein
MATRSLRVLAALWLALAIAAMVEPGCGSSAHTGASGTGAHGGSSSAGPAGGMGGGTGGQIFTGSGGTGGLPVSSLAISPQNPVLDVTVVDGMVTSVKLGNVVENPLTFTATEGGSPVQATWSLDRGELGALVAASGAFTPSANVAGTGKVTATFGSDQATTTLTVSLHVTQNGAPANEPPNTGNGVGGNSLGGAVPPSVQGQLASMSQTPPVAASDLAWLYPYDQTVWPRGVLAPLLQWQTSHAAVTAVYVHLSEAGYDFQGTYDVTGLATQNQPVEATTWTQALNSNTGDKLHVDLKIYAGGTVYGPVSEDWIVAPGLLTGTVYYNSYNSQIPMKPANAPAGAYGAVLSIQPGAQSPGVAIPSTNAACHVCHTVSADGSTIVMQGPSYKNQDPPTLDRTTVFSLKTQQQTAYFADGTSNQNKFDWGAVYPDGTMAVANSGDGFHHYSGNSDLFSLADGSTIPSTGFEGVVNQAVTPVFSPDGRHLAFSFLSGPGSASVQPSALHTLALLDFDCGAPSGSVTCTSGGTYTFSNLRLLDSDMTRYVGWPSFLPDSSAVVFQSTYKATSSGGSNLYTWGGAEAEVWYVPAPAAGAPTPAAVPLYALNGFDATGKSYLPTIPGTHGTEPTLNRPLDTVLNYEPTVNPIASGGYFWVVFTSRRAYGNVLTGDPWADESSGTPQPFTKKLWVAAVDINPTPGKDPSHPAFYLPGQELLAGNARGYWVVDPCKADGQSCQTGSECCGGFCQQGDGGALVCGSMTTTGCSGDFDKCTTTADCCAGEGLVCINGHCALTPPQ